MMTPQTATKALMQTSDVVIGLFGDVCDGWQPGRHIVTKVGCR